MNIGNLLGVETSYSSDSHWYIRQESMNKSGYRRGGKKGYKKHKDTPVLWGNKRLQGKGKRQAKLAIYHRERRGFSGK